MEETACDGLSRFKPFHARFSRTSYKIHAGFLDRSALPIVENNLRCRLVHSKLVTNFLDF